MIVKNYWNSTATMPQSSWPSAVQDEANIVIIGAGGAGLATAVTLGLDAVEDVVVIDSSIPSLRGARKGIGAAPLWLKPIKDFQKYGYSTEDMFKYLRMSFIGMKNSLDFIQRFGEGLGNDDWCHLRQFGGFHLSQSKFESETLKEVSALYSEAGVLSTVMDVSAIRRLTHLKVNYPGIFVPNEFMVNPARYYNGMIKACDLLGIDVISGYHVNSVYEKGGKWIIDDGLSNYIKCNHLILCTGAHLDALPEIEDLDNIVIRNRVTYGATKEIATMRLQPYIISSYDGKFISRRYDNRIVVAMNDGSFLPCDLKAPTHRGLQSALQQMLALYPVVSDKERSFEYVWTKNILTTKDSLPIICEVPERKRLYLNIGYNIDSIGWQFIGAAITKKLLLESQPPEGVELFSLERIS